MPGCDILRSYDLMNWEFVCHAYETLDDTPGHNLEGTNQIYGNGMWAPSFCYHNGIFYINFTANDTHKTYLLTANNPAGPWNKRTIEGFYYDSSLFFDDDDRVYIVHGQGKLYVTELDSEVKGPLAGGLDRLIVQDEESVVLGYEGSHLYKKDGRYYLFTCHGLAYGNKWKTEDCFIADSLTGEFRGKCIIDDDMGYHRLGVAQGGMVDTPAGDWYAFMYQDRGALGRAPMIMPLHFDDDGFPVVGTDGKVPEMVSVPSTRPHYVYTPLNSDDNFDYQPDKTGKIKLKPCWQFNHNPQYGLWSVTDRPGAYRIYSGKVCSSLVYGYNTLTQRTFGPKSEACVTVDARQLKEGDYAGISAFLGCYGAVAFTKEEGKYYLVMLGKPALNDTSITLKVHADFEDKHDKASFFYLAKDKWIKIGIDQQQYFKVDHFTGCRFGLFLFSTKEPGGYVDFMKFRYKIIE